jgi:hypothetical protein
MLSAALSFDSLLGELSQTIDEIGDPCKITPTSAPHSHLTSAGDSHLLRHPIHA